MRRSLALLIFGAFTLSACGHLPETRVKQTMFKSGTKSDITISSEIKPEDIEIYEGQYPDGIEKDGDLIRVKSGYEGKIKLIGSIGVDLKRGMMTSPFPVGPKPGIYVNNEDLSGLHKYCRAMNWQNGIFLLVMWIPNYLGPWNYPCYFMKDMSGEDGKEIDYRTATLKHEMQLAAKKMGGNAVVGYQVGGITFVSSNTGATLANTNAWTASGFVVAME